MGSCITNDVIAPLYLRSRVATHQIYIVQMRRDQIHQMIIKASDQLVLSSIIPSVFFLAIHRKVSHNCLLLKECKVWWFDEFIAKSSNFQSAFASRTKPKWTWEAFTSKAFRKLLVSGAMKSAKFIKKLFFPPIIQSEYQSMMSLRCLPFSSHSLCLVRFQRLDWIGYNLFWSFFALMRCRLNTRRTICNVIAMGAWSIFAT